MIYGIWQYARPDDATIWVADDGMETAAANPIAILIFPFEGNDRGLGTFRRCLFKLTHWRAALGNGRTVGVE